MSKLLSAAFFAFFLTHSARAWNAEGHMVVAQIAYNHLDSEVKSKCDALVAMPVSYSSSINSNFVTAAVWADDIKSFTSAYSTQHYIDIPISLDGYPTNQVVDNPANVVTAIRQDIATLQDPAASLSNQAVALRFLLHFVGDIQQPLHCSTGVTTNRPSGDAGGNGFSLGTGNLHSFWDGGGGYLSDFLRRPLDSSGQATLSNKAAAIEATYPYTAGVGTIPDPLDWAMEGREIARTNTYIGVTNGLPASASYSDRTQLTTAQRMAIGGQRLAKLLSTLFVTNAPTLISTTLTNGNFNLSWNSILGRIYRVQWKNDLADASWSDLTDLTASTNAISFSDPLVQTKRFYRVIVVN